MRRGAKTGVIGAILLGLLGVGAVLTWTALDKKITVQVDGAAPRTVHTMSADVRGALADAGYPLGAHDQVTPAANKSVREGLDIHLLRGRLLTLTVDGKLDNEWVAATTVGDALALLGFDTSAYSSLPASDRLPLVPTAITVRTAKSVTLIRAGKSDSIASTAPSVGALLAQQGITVGPNDMLSAPPSTPLTDLMTITWKQVRHRTVTAALAIPYGTSWQDDPARPDGQSTVVTAGVAGLRTVTYDVLMVDGEQIARTAVSDVVTTPPVTQVVSVGTKVVAAPPPSTAASGPTATPAPSTAAPEPATTSTDSPTTTPTPQPVATPTPAPHPVATPTPTAGGHADPDAASGRDANRQAHRQAPGQQAGQQAGSATHQTGRSAGCDQTGTQAGTSETGPAARTPTGADDRHRGDAGRSSGHRQVDDAHVRLEHHERIQLPGPALERGKRLAVERHQPVQRRVRHPAGLAGQPDGDGRSGLEDQPAHPDQVGHGVHQGPLRHALRGAESVARPITALVLSEPPRASTPAE